MKFRLGCDIGGTFTDFVLINEEGGQIFVHKCLTTPADPSEAVEEGIRAMLKSAPGFIGKLSEIIHGTTLVINAIIERKGALTGLITTKGFRDVLELGREIRYDAYDIFSEYPPPLASRNFRAEVAERIAADGRILIALKEEEAEAVIRELLDKGIKSLAICLINSFGNPVHENKIKEIAERISPDLFISTSYETLPQIREYERTSTTVANAYVKPVTNSYLNKLDERLGDLGFQGNFFMMLSSGGITTAETARRFPVRIIESGPTAAVIASQYYGRMFDLKDMFCFDMGGTTAKSCLIQRGEAGLVSTFEVGRVQRFKKGSGLPIQVPVVDLMEIGAGGGSIAKINKMGLLQVGPESAGADPGPACYARGGQNPAVTDADLVLGYLNEDFFLGGTMKLDRASSKKAIEEKIANPLGTSTIEAALGIHDLINETMAAAAKTHIAEKGGNPGLVTISAFGGAGPVHAYGLAKKIGARQIMAPPMAGVGSAFGFFTAPIAFDLSRSRLVALEEADFGEIEKLFRELEEEGQSIVQKSSPGEELIFERSINMRFIGQGSETKLTVDRKDFGKWSKRQIRDLFDKEYRRLYGRSYPETPVEFVTFQARISAPLKPFHMPKLETECFETQECVKGTRPAFSLIKNDFIPFTVYDRSKFYAGYSFSGPAIVEEKESTIVMGEDSEARVDQHGFVWITLKETT